MVDFGFYKDTYRGQVLSQEDWDVFSARAQEHMDRFKRIYMVTGQGEELAVCAMAEALYSFRDGGGAVSSASIGSVSVRYDPCMDLSAKGQERELFRILRRYMQVYRGVSV